MFFILVLSDSEEEEEDKTIDQCLFRIFPLQNQFSPPLAHSLANVPSKSTTTSIQSPYIWNQSTQSLETTSEKSFLEYHGRMTSQSTLSSTDPWKSKLSSFTTFYKQHLSFIKKNLNGMNTSSTISNRKNILNTFIFPTPMKYSMKNSSILPRNLPPIDPVH